MIPEIKVNHWRWCETQGNSPHERWEWCEVNEEVDVYTALWLFKNQNLDYVGYVDALGNTEWAKNYLEAFLSECYYKDRLTEAGFDIIESYLAGIQDSQKPKDIIYIDESLYTNEN